MVLVYFDSSALVKLLVEEPGSDVAVALWDGCDAAFSSRLANPEVSAALAAAHRNHQLDDAQLRAAQRTWSRFWDSMRPVELSEIVEQHAARLVAAHALRGADAVHLASALTITDPSPLLAAWDNRLRAGAAAEILAIAPASIA
ncbi:MAG: type II toxin-antitoxin system VapC family toxin [Acidimicrobiales bacterium]|nr:type II toxin-antitoxin system VapC family toxin [Acidimicrobiales bacterium]